MISHPASQSGSPRDPAAARIRIVVVEDEPSLRMDMVDYLQAHGYDAVGCATAAAFRAELDNNAAPDLVVLDVNLPDGNGFSLARDLRQDSTCGIVMLTMRSTPGDRVEGLESGADAYLVKHSSLREIEATIRSVLRRLQRSSAPMAAPGGAPWLFQPLEWYLQAPGGGEIRLTGSEVAFLRVLVEKAGKPCTREEIQRALARPNQRSDDRAIDAMVRRLRRKISEHGGEEPPIKMIYGIGYSFSAPVRLG